MVSASAAKAAQRERVRDALSFKISPKEAWFARGHEKEKGGLPSANRRRQSPCMSGREACFYRSAFILRGQAAFACWKVGLPDRFGLAKP